MATRRQVGYRLRPVPESAPDLAPAPVPAPEPEPAPAAAWVVAPGKVVYAPAGTYLAGTTIVPGAFGASRGAWDTLLANGTIRVSPG